MSDPDSDLIPGLRAGDETALRALMDRRMRTVHPFRAAARALSPLPGGWRTAIIHFSDRPSA